MADFPKIAIIGRPNVGKSALFNCIIKKRASIVADVDGVTRDRLYGTGELFGRPFQAIDTGGMFCSTVDFAEQITQQAERAIKEADGIIQVVDGRVGPQPLDLEIAKLLRRTRKPLVLAVNKIDSFDNDERLYEFSSLGLQPMVETSATHRYQIAELLDLLLQQIRTIPVEQDKETYPTIAIIGRPNVGKSTLLNTLVGTNRSIVSEVPGTTRDTIDTTVVYNKTTYTFIDTAGIRRKHKEHSAIEKFACIRTHEAIERSDLCLLVVDCQAGIGSEDKKTARTIEQANKGCIILFNKWDLVHHVRMEHGIKGLEKEVPFLYHCPKVFLSAKTGRNVEQLFSLINRSLIDLDRRIPTHTLNKSLDRWKRQYQPPMINGNCLRIYYMAQIGTSPPHFVLFVNNSKLIDNGYRRYIINQLRTEEQYKGVPIILTIRGKPAKK